MSHNVYTNPCWVQHKSNVSEFLGYEWTIDRILYEVQALFVVSFSSFLDTCRAVHQKPDIYLGLTF